MIRHNMKYIHLGVCICIFLFVHNQILRADETVSDDSLYTAGYINSIYIAQPERALQLLDEAEKQFLCGLSMSCVVCHIAICI